MIINEIKINNFYCFINEVLIFKKGLNIISAKNGDGKSMLFNAFHWTLFNKLYIQTESGKKEWVNASREHVYPYKVEKESKVGDRFTSSVELKILANFHEKSGNESVEYTFTKKVIYEKGETEIITYQKPDLEISYVLNGETKYIDSHLHNSVLDSVFPTTIRKFMWYQGETMEELFDFSQPSTLKYAIKNISYFPLYDTMNSIVKKSEKSISKKILAEQKKEERLSKKEKNLISSIEKNLSDIKNKEEAIQSTRDDVSKLEDDIAAIELKMANFHKYDEIKIKVNRLEADDRSLGKRIEDADRYIKRTLIEKWMLNKCDSIIADSKNKLNIISETLQEHQKDSNPIPRSLPGPEYVEKMIDDHMCYICERKVEDNSPALDALKRRLNDFEKNSELKILQDNFTDLKRERKKLLSSLPSIKDEIHEEYKRRESNIEKRKAIRKQITKIYEQAGDEQGTNITDGSSNYNLLLSKVRSLRNTLKTKSSQLEYNSRTLSNLQIEQHELNEQKNKIIGVSDSSLVEVEAQKYIKVFSKVIERLKDKAFNELISEITEESNRLYATYLGGKNQGEIKIDHGIQIVDRYTGEELRDFGGAESALQKAAVAFSFLSISANKFNKSYPIISDAPTSDLDPANTKFFTTSISKSFDQVIIMSKDYLGLDKDTRDNLIREANISRYYEFNYDKIDANGPDTRKNKKTFIKEIR